MEFMPVGKVKQAKEFSVHARMFQATQRRHSAVSVLLQAHRSCNTADSAERTDTLVKRLSVVEEATRSPHLVRANRGAAQAIHALRADLNDGLEDLAVTIEQGFARVGTQLEQGFVRVARSIDELKSVPDWYRSFARGKKRIWTLACRLQFDRAVDESLAALSTTDRTRSASNPIPDEIRYDPELNLFVAQAVVLGLVPTSKALGENPFAFALRAYEGGCRSDDPSEAQAAADAAHLLAIYARAAGKLKWAMDLDLESYRLEQLDKVAGLARAYAALAVVEDPKLVGQAVAFASLVVPRFGALWLTRPALLADHARARATLEAAESCLTRGLSRANSVCKRSLMTWSSAISPLPMGRGTHLALPEQRQSRRSLLELANVCRGVFSAAASSLDALHGRVEQGVEDATRQANREIERLHECIGAIEGERNRVRDRYDSWLRWIQYSSRIRAVAWLGSPALGLYVFYVGMREYRSLEASLKTAGVATAIAVLICIVLYYAIKMALSSAAREQLERARIEARPYEDKVHEVREALEALGRAGKSTGL